MAEKLCFIALVIGYLVLFIPLTNLHYYFLLTLRKRIGYTKYILFWLINIALCILIIYLLTEEYINRYILLGILAADYTTSYYLKRHIERKYASESNDT